MEENKYLETFNNLHQQYIKNEVKMKSMESFNNVNSPEYRKLLSEQNNIITKLQSLQTELTNSNYEKQNNLESLSSEVIELQKEIKSLQKRQKEIEDNSDSASGLLEQTQYIVETSFFYLIGKILILFFPNVFNLQSYGYNIYCEYNQRKYQSN